MAETRFYMHIERATKTKGDIMEKEKIIAIIPARYQSSRFPGKPLALLNGKPMIQWVYENVNRVEDIMDTYVATDDVRILNSVKDFGGKAIMTSSEHRSGTDRIAECVDILKLDENDIILNVQGDEPLIQKEMMQDLISTIKDSESYMGTLKEKIRNTDDLENPNIVKVITNIHNNAIYFSRFPIPYCREKTEKMDLYRHVGVYAYRVFFLKKYIKLSESMLEKVESLEQLRVIENGYTMKVKETKSISMGVDTKEQLQIVEEIMKREMK